MERSIIFILICHIVTTLGIAFSEYPDGGPNMVLLLMSAAGIAVTLYLFATGKVSDRMLFVILTVIMLIQFSPFYKVGAHMLYPLVLPVSGIILLLAGNLIAEHR